MEKVSGKKKININKKYIFIVALLVITVFTIIFTASYAFFTTTVTSKEFVVYTGTLAVDYKKKTDVINLDNLYPMTNSQGLELNAHEFSVENNGNIDARYQIRLEVSEDNMIPIEYIKVSLKENDNDYTEPKLLSNLNSSLVLLSNKIINPTKSNDYKIKLWIDINAPNDIQGKTFKARIVVDSIQNVEDGFITNTVPIITLNKTDKGNTDINLEVNDTYTELGVKKVEDDQDILTPDQVVKTYEYYDGSNLTTVSKVDTTKTGIYYITYSVIDKSNNTGKAVRVVTVNNTQTLPTITLKGDSNITLGEYDNYIERGVTVEDNNNVTIIGEVKTSKIGTYIVKYIVVDKNNNLNSTTRTVIVNEAYKEELLNGADPVLTQNLVPVQISDTGKVTKSSTLSTWYDYETKNWANVVVMRNSYDSLNSNGKVAGATKKDGYVSFDGVDDYINLGLKNYDFGNTITIAARFKVNEFDDGESDILGNWQASGGGIYLMGDEHIHGDVYVDGSGWLEITSTNKIVKGKYYTAVIVYNGTELVLYIDGVEDNRVSGTGSIKISTMPALIGANPEGNNENLFFGNIDIKQVAIFDRVVTQEEIQEGFDTDIRIYNNSDLLVYEDFSNKLYDNNETISENNIESYFVWIPKYSYQLWDLGNYSTLTAIDSTKPHVIPIKFGLTNTSDSNTGECKTPGVAGESGACQVGDYMTHPAFLAFNTNGLWVGKFETGFDGAKNSEGGLVNSSDSSKIIIKPNVYSWRYNTLGSMFKASYNYFRNDESHMMKNTEWGSVAYLQHSKYGSSTSVRVNNNEADVTGNAAVDEPTKGNNITSIEGNRHEFIEAGFDGTYTINYLNPDSVVASTTGNYTGIYDMVGCTWEYVMGYTTNASTTSDYSYITSYYSDFFTNSEWDKYYDKYLSGVITNFNNRILGDATGEMGPFAHQQDPDDATRIKSSWYNDISNYVYSELPWFRRGGYFSNGNGAGIFTFHGTRGTLEYNHSFRIVLAP